jgi:hypothetical protein
VGVLEPWTPDHLLTYLGRQGVRLRALDQTEGVVAVTVDGNRYVGQVGGLQRMARHILKQEANSGIRRQAAQGAGR